MKIILIDTAYTSFYRFFAAIKWYSYAYPDEFKTIKKNGNLQNYDWTKNNQFISKYEKMYLQSILKIIGKDLDNSLVIFCNDAPMKTLWRNEVDINYKTNRKTLIQTWHFGSVGKYTKHVIIPKILENKLFKRIQVEKAEADDIIGTIAHYLESKHPNIELYIVSGDSDFYQLCRENVYIYNYKQKKQIQFSKEEANAILLKKIINGDPSDSIKPILCGVKISREQKAQIFKNPDKLKEFLNQNPKIKEKFKINNKLINLSFVPANIKKQIIYEFKKILPTKRFLL